MKKSIAIIGAGASGLVAAISSKNSQTDVTIFEKSNRVGKRYSPLATDTATSQTLT